MLIQRLKGDLAFERLCNGDLRMISRKLDMHFTVAKERRELIERLWLGVSPADMAALREGDSVLAGWLLSLAELGLIESSSTFRTQEPAWKEASREESMQRVRVPWSHVLIFVWSVALAYLTIVQMALGSEHESVSLSALGYAIFALVVLGASVLLHELTHLVAARALGVRDGVLSFVSNGRLAPRYVMPHNEKLSMPAIRYGIYMAAPVFDAVVGMLAMLASWQWSGQAISILSIPPLLFCAYSALPLHDSDAAKAWDCVRESHGGRSARWISFGYGAASTGAITAVLALCLVWTIRVTSRTW
ncbi:hypothetical protein [Xanthomonas albilineans]|uniref:hypothetical protein n=1 Tax=Xanthomonas albilineans TaxID=29447 RepID=UPI0005F35CF5|nr:hypothetical protein [Xanthomonas albilineans]